MTDDERPRLEINWVQSMAGALAAVSSAVLLSTFGVAGTLIGAAIGSLVITMGGAVYSYSIRATKERVAMAQTVAVARIGLAQARVREAAEETAGGTASGREHVAEDLAEDLTEAEVDLDRAQAMLQDADDEEDERLGWRNVLAGLPWKRIAVVTSAIFVVAMLAILTFELITGRAVSTYTGGTDGDRRTSIPGLGGGASGEEAPAETPVPEESEAPGGVTPPAEQTTEPVPSEVPTVAPSAPPTSDPEPTPEPTPVPTEPAPSP